MLWCDSVAPFGKPVVPEVYWMLIGSSKPSAAARSRQRGGARPVSGRDQRVPVGLADETRAELGQAATSATIAR